MSLFDSFASIRVIRGSNSDGFGSENASRLLVCFVGKQIFNQFAVR
jgi:hypothetical protein